jgi:phosphoribosylaminoimidazole-succinocarboxamide synthase
MYRAGRREIYGIPFPDGLRANQKLPSTIVTPTTKAADGEHDLPLTAAEILDRRLLTAGQWRSVSETALALFARGRGLARERGLILADTKYEFGFDAAGRIVLADEIHTPDSSRYWLAASYQQRFAAAEPPDSLDKDFVRRWVAARCDPYREPVPPIPRAVVAEAARLYVEAYETITGEPIELPDPTVAVIDRIRARLVPYFAMARRSLP